MEGCGISLSDRGREHGERTSSHQVKGKQIHRLDPEHMRPAIETEVSLYD